MLTAAEVQTILDACTRLRDRLLFAVLYDTGMRIGEALGLRHEDLAAAEREVSITARVNDNGARVKTGRSRTIPVGTDLLRLYADYLHAEYGDLDSDHVFVNLWGDRSDMRYPTGLSTTWSCGYASGPGLTSTRTGSGTPRPRGCCVTRSRSRWSPSCWARLGDHDRRHLRTPHQEDARRVLEQAGWFTGTEVRL